MYTKFSLFQPHLSWNSFPSARVMYFTVLCNKSRFFNFSLSFIIWITFAAVLFYHASKASLSTCVVFRPSLRQLSPPFAFFRHAPFAPSSPACDNLPPTSTILHHLYGNCLHCCAVFHCLGCLSPVYRDYLYCPLLPECLHCL
jgi:hypothetical protein